MERHNLWCVGRLYEESTLRRAYALLSLPRWFHERALLRGDDLPGLRLIQAMGRKEMQGLHARYHYCGDPDLPVAEDDGMPERSTG